MRRSAFRSADVHFACTIIITVPVYNAGAASHKTVTSSARDTTLYYVRQFTLPTGLTKFVAPSRRQLRRALLIFRVEWATNFVNPCYC